MDNLIYTFLLVLTIVISPTSVCAEALIDQSSNIFKFQQTLAHRGEVSSQYRLAYLYETGNGVEYDLEKALYWYERAARSGMKEAEHRITYLTVKELGYNKKLHESWLNSVKKNADNQKSEAILLLGQLYRQGLGVDKDLKKSLGLLEHLSALGVADVENEIALIQIEMSTASKFN